MLLKTSYKMKPPQSARLNIGHPLADKLIACYLFNEASGVKAFDSSGRGHHGTLTGGVTRVISRFGRGIDVDGTDGHIVIPDHTDFTPSLQPFSVSADIFMHDATNFRLASKGVKDVDGEWIFGVASDDRMYETFYYNSVVNCFIGRKYGTVLTGYEDRWVQLLLTYDGGVLSSGIRIYLDTLRIDNVDNQSNAASFVTVENLTGEVHIGRYSGNYANGVFDNIMFWRRVLTQSDIAKLHVDRFCMFERRRHDLYG